MVIASAIKLRRRLARGCGASVLAGLVSADRQAAHAGREEGERIILVLVVEVVTSPSRSRAVASRLEGSLGSPAVKGTSRVGAWGGPEVGVEGGVWSGTAGKARGEGVGAGRTTEVLAVTSTGAEVSAGGGERSGPGSAAH